MFVTKSPGCAAGFEGVAAVSVVAAAESTDPDNSATVVELHSGRFVDYPATASSPP